MGIDTTLLHESAGAALFGCEAVGQSNNFAQPPAVEALDKA